jgi:hypothetical protein
MVESNSAVWGIILDRITGRLVLHLPLAVPPDSSVAARGGSLLSPSPFSLSPNSRVQFRSASGKFLQLFARL